MLLLESANRTSGTINSYSTAFSTPLKNIKGFSIDFVEFSLNIPNINESNRYYDIEFFESNTISGSVPIGNYSTSTLKTALEASLNALGHSTFTVTFSDVNFTCTIQHNVSQNFRLLFASGTNSTKNLSSVLGFTPGSDTLFHGSLTGENPFHLIPPSVVEIRSTALTSNMQVPNRDGDSLSQAICMVPIDTIYGSTVIYRPMDCVFDFIRPITFSTIDIQITDTNGNPLALAETWSCCLILRS